MAKRVRIVSAGLSALLFLACGTGSEPPAQEESDAQASDTSGDPASTETDGAAANEDAGATDAAGHGDAAHGNETGDAGGVDAGADAGPPPCKNGKKDGDETGTDCGGTCADRCKALEGCKGPSDCESSLACVKGVCAAPSATDGVRDGDETDADCGGVTAPACSDGKACAKGQDCASRVCTDKVCRAPTSTDKVTNGTETDTDCGGGAPTNAPKCSDGKACKTGADCTSLSCPAGTCLAPTSADGIKNGTETDTDCGGGAPTNAPKCASGKACKTGVDCTSLSCPAGTCLAPTSADGVKNGSETDTDCGGGAPTNAPKCASGKACKTGADCTSLSCPAGTCLAPTSADGVKNGSETDTDCGGGAPTNAPKCASGKACLAHTDCASDGCDDTNHCANGRSCTQHEGGDTCGPNGDESCCGSLPVKAANNVQLDKYTITAGRMRAFITRVDGNVRRYMETHPPAWWDAGWNKYLPIQMAGGATYESVYEQLGGGEYGTTGPANEACWIGTGQDQIGARTYWMPAAGLNQSGTVQLYPQADMDRRALNCVTAYMIAAFCAWDGGRLPTRAELDAAWGPTTYPWGASPKPAGWIYAFDTQQTVSVGDTLWLNGLDDNPPTCKYTGPNGVCDPARANFVYNYWGGLTQKSNDYTLFIAPPGRFPSGNGPDGHADLAGLVFNFTTISSGKTLWSKNGSWQGHNIPFVDVDVPATNKYWAAGGRCAR